MIEPPSTCPACGGPLAKGGLTLSCRRCEWIPSIEEVAEWIGFADVEVVDTHV